MVGWCRYVCAVPGGVASCVLTPPPLPHCSLVQDDDKDVRAYVLRKVYDGLTKRPASQALGVRYLAYFALAAHDSDV